LKACTGIEILKISADANFEDPLTAPLNPRLNNGRHTSLQLMAARRPSRGLVKPDVIILVPGKTSVRGDQTSPGSRMHACDGLLQRKQIQMHRVNWHAIFDMRSGRLTSGYRFVKPIYRLSDIV